MKLLEPLCFDSLDEAILDRNANWGGTDNRDTGIRSVRISRTRAHRFCRRYEVVVWGMALGGE
jgi:hypothetical protein